MLHQSSHHSSHSQEELSCLDPALPLDDPERTRLAKEIELQARLYSSSQLMSTSTTVTSIVETKLDLVGRQPSSDLHIDYRIL